MKVSKYEKKKKRDLRSLKYYPFVIISKSFVMKIQVFPSCTRHVHDYEAIYGKPSFRYNFVSVILVNPHIRLIVSLIEEIFFQNISIL